MVRAAAVFIATAAALCAAPKLAVERMALHQFEDGPLLESSYEFLPGETAYFSCRLSGYQIEKKGDSQRVKLSWEIQILDPAGIPIEKPKAGRIEDQLLPEDKDWIPKFLATFTVPPFAPSGAYRIQVSAKDELAGTELGAALPFKVRGHDVEPSATLVARNFRFMRSEQDAAELVDPVFHPGQMLWARFDVTGYKFGPNNRFSVVYGLAVETAGGKQVFSRPETGTETGEGFYPQRYIPGVVSLSLDPNVAAATYTLVITVQDQIGGQSWEQRAPFRVE